MRTLARLLGLPRADRRLVLHALRWLVVVRIELAWLTLPKLQQRIRSLPVSTVDVVATDRAAWAVRAVADRLPGTTCLVRALALQALLQQAGQSAELCIGVRRNATGGLEAHAWIDCAGTSIDPSSELERFSPLPLPRPIE